MKRADRVSKRGESVKRKKSEVRKHRYVEHKYQASIENAPSVGRACADVNGGIPTACIRRPAGEFAKRLDKDGNRCDPRVQI